MNYRAIKFDENPLLRPGLPIGRSRLLQWVLLLILLLLIARSFYLQFVQDEFLQRKGESLYKRTIEAPAIRGRISDRNQEVLAMATPVKSIWINSNEIRALLKDADNASLISKEQLAKVARLLEVPQAQIEKKLSERSDFVYLKRQISPELADKIQALNLPGVYVQTEYRRYYPGGSVMAHVVGFVSVDGQGQEGLELHYQKDLVGVAGKRQVLKDRKGHIVEEVNEIRAAQNGQDLVLSLDSTIQYFAYQRLKAAIETTGAKAGSVVVMDAQTGEILALVNYPSFNPNNRETFTANRLRNRAVTDMFEPGSVIKPFTIALALEKGLVRPETQLDLTPGFLMFGNKKIRDAHPYDRLTVSEIIAKSSNIGTAKIAAMMDNQSMRQMFSQLGFGKPTKIELPGEASGVLSPSNKWRPIDRAVISYGHSMSANLIQLAAAYSVFARSDGKMVQPTVFMRDRPALSGQIFSPKTVFAVRKMLENTVFSGATGALAAVDGYRVGGKTGTALKIEKGRYTQKYQVSFVGIGPMSNPRLIVAVTVDEPVHGSYYAGAVAAPIFSDVMASALRQIGLLPDAPRSLSRRSVDPETLVEGDQL